MPSTTTPKRPDPSTTEQEDEGTPTKDEEEERDFGFFYWPGGITILNFGTHESPKELIGNSAYAYFLINNLWACLLALAVVVFQMYLFWILWNDSADEGINDEFQTTPDYTVGLMGASFMLALRVLPHVGRSFELVFMGTGLTHTIQSRAVPGPQSLRRCDLRLVVVGLLDLLVAAACVLVGVRFSLYQATSVIRTITIATVAVFIEGIDEQFASFLDYWSSPAWIQWKNRQMDVKYGNRKQYLDRIDQHDPLVSAAYAAAAASSSLLIGGGGGNNHRDDDVEMQG